jgi:3-deoxy-D-manno-octulosonic-acid transferase
MRKALPFPLRFWRAVSAPLRLGATPFLMWRASKGKEERGRLGERRGESAVPRPDGRLIWMHGASVGETVSLLPLIERLVQRGFPVLITSGTVTSARVLEKRLPAGALHQFVPLDIPAFVTRFLDHWQPDLILIAESELWPNMISAASERGTPLIMVNGRMSQRSYRRWSQFRSIAESVLSRFDLCLAQSDDDGRRLSALGAPRIAVSGNLKFDVLPPPADPMKVSSLAGIIGDRPVWMAASTHPGEEDILFAIHRVLVPHFPGLVTIIAPRHPHRGDDIAATAQNYGLNTARRSQGLLPDGATDIYIVDTVGELGLFYRVTPLVFMGGSLVPHGGQNPIEPGKLGAAILHGPFIGNFTDVYAALDEAGGAFEAKDAKELAQTASDLLWDTARLRVTARLAHDTVMKLGGAADRTLVELEPYLIQMHLEGS